MSPADEATDTHRVFDKDPKAGRALAADGAAASTARWKLSSQAREAANRLGDAAGPAKITRRQSMRCRRLQAATSSSMVQHVLRPRTPRKE